ncbi:MAG TPA: peptide chain release factor N(5)-glutamine methyltransferase [candidate division Zixibacteria bacterium]
MSKVCLEVLQEAKAKLKKKKAQTAQLEAELILSSVLKCERIKLHLDPKRVLTKAEHKLFEKLLKQRLSGKPLQYTLGEAYFFGYKFKVNPNVLIPRPETEILVSEVISLLRTKENSKIIDLGTGCGNIATGLALNLKDAFIFATDISPNALKVAKLNAKLNRVEDRIKFLCGDLFKPIKTKFDAIVSNPPYVSEKEYTKLPDEIKNFEPKEALLAGKDGLEYIKKIVEQAPGFLNKDGILALEIGFGQERKVKELVFNSKFLKLIEIKKDLSGIPRVMLARKL